MTREWIHGDGGPSIVLQSGAVQAWEGAANFANSLMGGGSLETDYDVICACPDGVSVIHRHDRDMLVLSDSEWAACFVHSEDHEMALVQSFGTNDGPAELLRRLLSKAPGEVLQFHALDPVLRLVVGSDSGAGEVYGFAECRIVPGMKVCNVYYSEEGQAVTLQPA